MRVLEAVVVVNARQKNILFEKFNKHFSGDIKGKEVTVWELSFKSETDDVREAPALVLIKNLIDKDCKIAVYDPVAMDEAKKKIRYAKDVYDCVCDAEAIFHVTEWKDFRLPNWEIIKKYHYCPVKNGTNINN